MFQNSKGGFEFMTMFAAIDVGSNEMSLKIFEISKKNGIKEADHIRHLIALGSETYANGKISHSLVMELCTVLQGFKFKMEEYKITEYTAYATSALREASNYLSIIDQIKVQCGIKVKILSNSEQRFLTYRAIALKETAFHDIIKKGTAIIDVGSGSLQISLFDKEALVATQNIRLGSLRIQELLASLRNQTDNFKNLMSEYIDNDVQTFHDLFLQNITIKHIIAVGDQINELLRYSPKWITSDYLKFEEYENLYHYWIKKTPEQINEELGISKEQASLILPTALIYHKMLDKINAEIVWFPKVTLCDGIAAEYAEKKEKLKPDHSFSADIIMAARNIASRYHTDIAHIENVEYLALSIFDRIRKLHGLGKRERLLLQIAVILHNCGKYINMNEVMENSYKIILSTEIIGISHKEREIVANLARYNSGKFPNYDYDFFSPEIGKDEYITITKLSAILRICNAMDKSHKQKFSKIQISISQKILTITTTTLEDITLERGLFENKADFFEEVYGIRPILKQKRSL